MALQLGALREALLEAGASAGKADAAAEKVASYERDMAGIRADLKVLKGIGGTLITLVILVLGGQVALWAKIADIVARH
jgi:hypothetical protein